MKSNIYNQTGEKIGDASLTATIFGVNFNRDLVHQAFVIQRANGRSVIAHTKDRSEIRGGGKKPWRQKGTGRARHGSTRSPIWKGGGITFGPTNERVFSRKINQKMRQKAVLMALSQRIKDGHYAIIDSISEESKTKKASQILKAIKDKIFNIKDDKGSFLFVFATGKEIGRRAFRNIEGIDTISAKSLNVVDIINHKYIIFIKDSLPVIEGIYTKI